MLQEAYNDSAVTAGAWCSAGQGRWSAAVWCLTNICMPHVLLRPQAVGPLQLRNTSLAAMTTGVAFLAGVSPLAPRRVHPA